MRPTRTLALRRETLTALSGEDLAAVAGGDAGVAGSHLCTTTSFSPFGCVQSFDACTPTLPVNPCLSIPTCR